MPSLLYGGKLFTFLKSQQKLWFTVLPPKEGPASVSWEDEWLPFADEGYRVDWAGFRLELRRKNVLSV